MKYFLWVFLCFILVFTKVNAKGIPKVYMEVASKYDIPIRVLYSVALAESGLSIHGVHKPWPWTLNIDGLGYRFDTFDDAEKALASAISNGKNVDIGIMQVSSYWHGKRVRHIYELLNPYQNLAVGAEILLEQKRRSEGWWEAVGRYHAPSDVIRARKYRNRVKSIYLNIGKQDV